MKKLMVILIGVFLAGSVYAGDVKGNSTIQSFNKAKKMLLRQVYQNSGRTFYCDCPFEGVKKSYLVTTILQNEKANVPSV